MYKDMILKIEYHKEYILKQFIKKGYFPKKDEIANKLSAIDNRIALFKTYKFQPGELFDTKEMNHCLLMLHKDLEFLYEVLKYCQEDQYNKLLLNIETHMTYLEALGEYYKKRANEEINSTTLGKTLLFLTDNWNIEFNDETVKVDLGELELIQGSEIACFANINNTNKKNVIFKFTHNDKDKEFTALPYNYNNETYLVPGEITIKDHELKLENEFNIDGEIVIPFDVNEKSDYKILGGRNKIVVTDKETNIISVHDFPTVERPFVAPSNCYISFYIANKGKIEYNFNKKPLHTNFSLQDGSINIIKDIQKVFLDVEKDFICYFELLKDCESWGTCESAIINNNQLIYSGKILLRDFKIKEYIKDKITNYKVQVNINEFDKDEVIDSIYIKEIE